MLIHANSCRINPRSLFTMCHRCRRFIIRWQTLPVESSPLRRAAARRKDVFRYRSTYLRAMSPSARDRSTARKSARRGLAPLPGAPDDVTSLPHSKNWWRHQLRCSPTTSEVRRNLRRNMQRQHRPLHAPPPRCYPRRKYNPRELLFRRNADGYHRRRRCSTRK